MPSAFIPLRDRGFARCFWGNGLSNIGQSMQAITVPFVIYQITGSRSWLGVAALLAQRPGLVATAIAGSLADRYTLRRMLLFAQALLVVFSTGFWLLWIGGHHSLRVFLALMICNGVVAGMVIPLWQSFISTIVPRDIMAPAVRLSSLQFAVARVVGPFAGGVVLERWGPGAAFALNAASYLAVMQAVLRAPRQAARARSGASPLAMMREGWRYTYRRRQLRVICTTVAVVGLCGWSLPQLFPAIAREQFHVKASRVGAMAGSNGLGSMTAALALAFLGTRVSRSRMASVGLLGWVAGLALLGTTSTFNVGLCSFFLMGVGHTTWVMAAQPAMMLQVHDEYRARASSTYMQGVMASPPIGAVLFGQLSEYIGLRGMALAMSGTLLTYLVYVRVAHGGYGFLDGDAPYPDPADARSDGSSSRYENGGAERDEMSLGTGRVEHGAAPANR